MRQYVAVSLVLVSVCLTVQALPADTDPFVVDTLLEGVWLFRAPEYPASHTNSLVIERDAGLLVIEAQPSPEAARQLLRAIARVSKKTIQYLVLSQATVESTGGASTFPESALVISSAYTHEVLADETRNIAGTAMLRAADPTTWAAPRRVLPELLLTSTIRLVDGKHAIDLSPVPQGHHAGSLMLRIPEQGFYYVGSMVSSDRNPYADAEHCNMRAWVSSLNSMAIQRPEWIVPLHGEPIDMVQLRRFRDSIAWVVGQVEYAFIERIQADKVISFAMDSPKLAEYFDLAADPSFVLSLFEKAREESARARRKRGGS